MQEFLDMKANNVLLNAVFWLQVGASMIECSLMEKKSYM